MLAGCGPIASGIKLQVLDGPVAEPCPHPRDLVSRGGTVADDEISIRRLGVALIHCGQEKAIAVDAYNEVVEIFAP